MGAASPASVTFEGPPTKARGNFSSRYMRLALGIPLLLHMLTAWGDMPKMPAMAEGPPSLSINAESECCAMMESVNQLSEQAKSSFQGVFYAHFMSANRELLTPAARISWILAQEKADGRTPENLAAEVGCSRPTLLNWANGNTEIDQVSLGLLLRFCEVTGVNWRWVVYGEEPRIIRYPLTDRVFSLAHKLAAMEAKHPDELVVVARMIEAAANLHGDKVD